MDLGRAGKVPVEWTWASHAGPCLLIHVLSQAVQQHPSRCFHLGPTCSPVSLITSFLPAAITRTDTVNKSSGGMQDLVQTCPVGVLFPLCMLISSLRERAGLCHGPRAPATQPGISQSDSPAWLLLSPEAPSRTFISKQFSKYMPRGLFLLNVATELKIVGMSR